jgi:hypothetical protein
VTASSPASPPRHLWLWRSRLARRGPARRPWPSLPRAPLPSRVSSHFRVCGDRYLGTGSWRPLSLSGLWLWLEFTSVVGVFQWESWGIAVPKAKTLGFIRRPYN